MRLSTIVSTITSIIIFTGCSTSRNVLVGQQVLHIKITSAAFVPQKYNSPEMDTIIQHQLMNYGIVIKAPLPVGTRQSNDVDIVVAYTDDWHWDIAMYLYSLNIKLYEGSTGYLLISGDWKNAYIHGFQDPKDVVKELLDDMFNKLTQLQQK